jgi:predicted RecB family nuclease
VLQNYHIESWVKEHPNQIMTPDMQRYIDSLSKIKPVKLYCFLENKYQPILMETITYQKWTPVNKIKNACMEDHLSDYLEYKFSFKSSHDSVDNMQQYIMKKGLDFEYHIKKEIENSYPSVCTTIGDSFDARSYDKYQATLKAIQEGYGFIFQPVLWNYDNHSYGCADLLIRSDYLGRYIPYQAPFPHYVVVDIKLNHDTDYLPYVKSQLHLYNEALGNMQRFKCHDAFIWSRSGLVRVPITVDIMDTTKDALKWIENIEFIDEDDPILLPNMKTKNISKFRKEKKMIAEKNHELTQLWNVGVKHRNNALEAGITSLQNPLLDADVLGIAGDFKKGIVNALIKSYQSWELVMGNITNLGGWMTNSRNYYLDIETVCMSHFLDLSANYIFMIGVGWMESGEWKYEKMVANGLTPFEEQRLLQRFVRLVGDNSVFHWGTHEKTVILPKLERYGITHRINLYDMNRWFLEEKIVIKWMLDFKLKTVVRAMCKNNMTKLEWDDMDNGLDAMYLAWKIYQGSESDDKMDSIIKYNEKDCFALSEIHRVLWDYK